MSDLEQWLKSGAYLPASMRDFHDQKDLFKALYDTIRIPDNLKHISWVDAHIFTIDIFLWWMARRGYTLQRCRARQEFMSLEGTVEAARNQRDEQFIAMMKESLSEKPTDPTVNPTHED